MTMAFFPPLITSASKLALVNTVVAEEAPMPRRTQRTRAKARISTVQWLRSKGDDDELSGEARVGMNHVRRLTGNDEG